MTRPSHRTRLPLLLSLLLLPAGLFLTGCDELSIAPRVANDGWTSSGAYPGKMIVGPAAKVGRGHARGFVIFGSDLRPASLGVFLTRGALLDLPSTSTQYLVALPLHINLAPFDHIGLNWNPGGHAPPGIYDTPHFDYHFYMIPIPEQRAIAGGAETNPPLSVFVPDGYVTTAESEPGMGVHYVDPSSPEFSGGTFTRTMIYGFHERDMIFIEPMVTNAFLLTHPNVSHSIPQPDAYQRTGLYPTRYSVRYDTARSAYLISLDNLTLRTAP